MGLGCSRVPTPAGLGVSESRAPVTLHVYDVGTSGTGTALNRLLSPLGAGAFHCGVEVYSIEWSFSDLRVPVGQKAGLSGVFGCPPRRCEGHTHYGSVYMGDTDCTEADVVRLVRAMEKEWLVQDYSMLSFNCCHFADTLAQRLGVGGIPPWVTSLADAGAAVEKSARDVASLRCCRTESSGDGCSADPLLAHEALSRPPCCRSRPEAGEEADGGDIHYLI